MPTIRLTILMAMAVLPATGAAEPSRPNILWITCEDTGPHLGCYGDGYAQTPNLDALAARGMIYVNAWSNAPVCAPARTAIISGLYPSSTGAEHMRSQVRPPPFLRVYPQFLRDAGYYCTNNSKEDYNSKNPARSGRIFNQAHWKNRRPGQPFFAVFNHTVTHESQIRKRRTRSTRPGTVHVPAYHPDKRRSPRLGTILRQHHGDGRPGRGICASWSRPAWPMTQLSFSMATTARGCRGASVRRATPGCTCR
jgi:uncharacterized sulfatase